VLQERDILLASEEPDFATHRAPAGEPATAEKGMYFATYRGIFIGREPALASDAGALVA